MKEKHIRILGPHKLWGDAIKYCYIDENGEMFVGNAEYESQVNFNPWTGEKAPTQMEVQSTGEWEDGTKYISYHKE